MYRDVLGKGKRDGAEHPPERKAHALAFGERLKIC
jgi:hypothetical protein